MAQRTATPPRLRTATRLLALLGAGTLATPLAASLAAEPTRTEPAASPVWTPDAGSSAVSDERSAPTLDRRLRDPRITESSGLARSTYARPLLWTHNDSGDSARLFAIGKDGRTRAVLRLGGAQAEDWEDVAAGPRHQLWVADIGDNAGDRREVSVYRVREPKRIGPRRVPATRYRLAYPDGPHDAETLLVRPRSGRVLIVTKSSEGGAIYRAPARLRSDRVNRLTRVASAPASVTGGSWAPGGRYLVLGTPGTAYGSARVGGPLTRIDLPERPQGESFEIARDRRALLVGSEGSQSPVYAVEVPASLRRGHGRPQPTSMSPANSAPATDLSGWTLDLVEDFDRLDTSRWNVRDRTYNSNEDSYLLAANATVRDGALVIRSRKESAGGRRYTSGYVDTNRTYSLPDRFRVEVRARVPMEKGLWPAPLWFRPADGSDGEIDLVETYGKERTRPLVHQTIHTSYGSGHQQSALTYPFARLGDEAGTGWHTYVVEKTRNRIEMQVDGVTTATWRSGDPAWFSRYYEAGKRWNLRINMQVGGSYGGLPDATTDWSRATMAIDYIRTWVPS